MLSMIISMSNSWFSIFRAGSVFGTARGGGGYWHGLTSPALTCSGWGHGESWTHLINILTLVLPGAGCRKRSRSQSYIALNSINVYHRLSISAYTDQALCVLSVTGEDVVYLRLLSQQRHGTRVCSWSTTALKVDQQHWRIQELTDGGRRFFPRIYTHHSWQSQPLVCSRGVRGHAPPDNFEI